MCSPEAADVLQQEIDHHLNGLSDQSELRIKLDNGSDVTDLSMCADVRVFEAGNNEWRLFSVISNQWAARVVPWDMPDHPRPELRGVFATGGPLIIVDRIEGRTIVLGVLRFLELEAVQNGRR